MITRALFAALLSVPCLYAMSQVPGKVKETGQILLPNGWKLTPAGRQIPAGDLPLNVQLSTSGKLLAVTNNGQSTQSVQLFDPKNEKLMDEKILTRSRYGLAFSRNEQHLYVSGGYDNSILDFNIQNNKIGKADTIKLALPYPKGNVCPTGMVTTRGNDRLYAVTKGDSSLYVINPMARTVTKKLRLPGMAYSCLLSPDEKTVEYTSRHLISIYYRAAQKSFMGKLEFYFITNLTFHNIKLTFS